jgi:hypothetical protein
VGSAPEPVYPPGDVYARLTPEPAGLLRAMGAGAVLKERVWKWTEWLHVTGQPPKKVPLRDLGIDLVRMRRPPGLQAFQQPRHRVRQCLTAVSSRAVPVADTIFCSFRTDRSDPDHALATTSNSSDRHLPRTTTDAAMNVAKRDVLTTEERTVVPVANPIQLAKSGESVETSAR